MSPLRKFYLAGGIAGVLVLAFTLGHGGWLAAQTADAKARTARLIALRSQFAAPDRSKAEEAKLAAEADKLRPQLAELEQTDAKLTADCDRIEKQVAEQAQYNLRVSGVQAIHRQALPELLAALADAEISEKPSEIVVKEVRQLESGELRLTGICNQTKTGDGFAAKLATRLSKSGWRVGAADKRLREDRYGFDFMVLLTPVVLGSTPPPAAPASTTRPSGASIVDAQAASVFIRPPAGVRSR